MVNFLTRINSFKTRAKLIFLFLLFLGGFIFLTSPSAAEAADKYWVGGTGNWNDTSHWSLSSGGAGGASVPSNSDDVYFDANSGTGTATVNVSATTKSLNFTGYTGTFAGSSALNISGSLTMGSGMTRTYTGSIVFSSTTSGNILTFNGKIMASNTTFDGVGGEWTLQDAWENSSGSRSIILQAGTFNTNNQTVTTSNQFMTSNSGNSAKTLNLGASQINVGTWNLSSQSNVAINSGTSTITTTGSFHGGGFIYNEVRITGSGSWITTSISGSNTFAILRRTNASGNDAGLQLQDNQIVTDTLQLAGNNTDTQRLIIVSESRGTTNTISVGDATVSLVNVDFEDITILGNNAPYGGTSIGDGQGNSGITFTPATTKYWVGGTGNWYSSSEWSTSSGGPGGAGMPLLQDAVVFDSNSFTAPSQTVSMNTNGYRIGKDITWVGVTNNPTWNIDRSGYIYGSLTLDSEMTITGGSELHFRGEGNNTITSNGNVLTGLVTIEAGSGTYSLGDDFSLERTLQLRSGTFDANDYNVTAFSFNCSGNQARTVTMGNGTWTLTGSNGTIWNATVDSNLTVNRGNDVVLTSMDSTGTRTLHMRKDDVAVGFRIVGGADNISLPPNAGHVHNLIFDGFNGTFTTNGYNYFTGDFIITENSLGMTIAPSEYTQLFHGESGTITIDTNGKLIDFPIQIEAANNNVTYLLESDLTVGSTRELSIQRGDFDANGYNVTAGFVRSSGSKTISMGSGTWEITGDSANLWYISDSPSQPLTLNSETSTIKLTGTLTANRNFRGGDKTYNNIENDTSGNFAITIVGSNTFNSFQIHPGRIQQFTAGTTTTVTSFEAVGTVDNPITITSATSSNHTLAKTGGGVISGDYLIISRSTATPSETWFAGNNSTDGENNSGWLFESPNDPPNAPTGLGPEGLVDGSYTNDNKPTFIFSLSDPDGADTLRYRIQIDDTSNFSSPVVDYTSGLAGQGSRSFTVGQVAGSGSYSVGSSGQSLSDGSYYWRVLATDSFGESSSYTAANSGAIAFIMDDTPPTAPGIPSTNTPTELLTHNWVWTAATDILSGIASYIWRVVDSLGNPIVNGATSLLESTTSLTPGVYNFFVKAIDNAGNEGPESEGQVAVITPTPTPTPQPTATPTPAPNPDPCPGFTVCPNVNGVGSQAPMLEIVSVGSTETPAEIIIPAESSSIDLKVTATQLDVAALTELSAPVPLPTRQGLNVVGDVYDFSAVSAFNGYPVASLEKPAIILLSYDPVKLQGKSPRTLRIAYYNSDRKRWMVLPRNTVINPDTNTIANTSTALTYYTVVYPQGSFYVAPQSNVREMPPKEISKIIKQTTPTPKPKQKKVIPKKPAPQKTCLLFICW